MEPGPRVVALAGGVGGAKLVDGLAAVLPSEALSVVVNTADDFEHLGLWISPDLDTIVYTLAGVANPETGWGRRDETWHFLQTLDDLGGPTWFRLGDRDLALHVERTRRLDSGETLSEITRYVCQRLGVRVRVLPMSDTPVSTVVCTELGDLPFQEYFVARRCEPRVLGFRFTGIEGALPAPGVLNAIREADLVVLCPSNPWVSLDPILAVESIREVVRSRKVVGVSPIVKGKALKGPADRMFRDLGFEPSAWAVARRFQDLLWGFVIDEADSSLRGRVQSLGMHVMVTKTVMRNQRDRRRLAEDVLHFGRGSGGEGS